MLGTPFFDLSASGRLVYRTGTATTNDVTPVWVERDGTFREIDPGWTLPFEQDMSNFALSPNVTRLAVSARGPEGTVDIYVKELDTGPLTRLTFEGTINRLPTWSPDGRSVSFVSDRAGQDDLWMRRADGSGRAELVLDMDEPITEALYSPDGVWLLFIMGTPPVGFGYGGSIIRLGVDMECATTPSSASGIPPQSIAFGSRPSSTNRRNEALTPGRISGQTLREVRSEDVRDTIMMLLDRMSDDAATVP